MTPYDFGAIGDGKVDDTVAMQKAVDAASAARRPLVLTKGRFLLTPQDLDQAWTAHQGAGSKPVFPCIRVTQSHLHVVGRGGTLLIGGTNPTESNAMFATARTMKPDALTGIRFENVVFELDARISLHVASPYVFVGFGIVGFALVGCTIQNSFAGKQRGWGVLLENSRQILFDRLIAHNLTQVFNGRYVYDVTIKDPVIDQVREVWDFDGVADRVTATGGRYTARGGGQIFDLSAVTAVRISSLTSNGYTEIATIYDKATTPRRYADFFTGTKHATPDYLTTNDVVVTDVRAIHSSRYDTHGKTGLGTPFQIGIERKADGSTRGRPAPNRITIQNVVSDDSGQIRIFEGTNIVLRNITLRADPTAIHDPQSSAIYATRNRRDVQVNTDSRLSLTLDNVTIEGSFGNPLRIFGAAPLSARGVTVNGRSADATLTALSGKGAN